MHNPFLMKETVMKVVICDDHDYYRSQLRRSISKFDEIDVMAEASNGIQLLSILSKNIPDIVLLDLQMPVMDGFHALTLIRRRYPSLHVFILFVNDADKQSPALNELGVSDFIHKETTTEAILDIITAKRTDKLRLTA